MLRSRNLTVTPLPDQPYSLILGLGQTGLSVARFLRAQGEPFVVADTREKPPLLQTLHDEMPEATIFTGLVDEVSIRQAARVIVSPGLAPDLPLLEVARRANVPLESDIGMFLSLATAPVVGITGSNAKSTVTSLVGEMARRAGMNVAVGGNLGVPSLELLAPDVELYVLELSSFQLTYTGQPVLSVGVMLNMSIDHLDWHGTADAYLAAKQRVFSATECAVYNRNDAATVPVSEQRKSVSFGNDLPSAGSVGLVEYAGKTWISRGGKNLIAINEIGMVGEHNLENALAAVAIAEAVGIPMTAVTEELREFSGLPHRAELVGQIGGNRWINDSKATNVGATLAALRGLSGEDGEKIVLIAGGQAKGADLSPLAGPMAASCRALVVMGEASTELLGLAGNLPSIQALSMEAAVASAAKFAAPGDTVLLSPACASFDMFDGFSDRGDQFRSAVLAWGESL